MTDQELRNKMREIASVHAPHKVEQLTDRLFKLAKEHRKLLGIED